MDEDSLKVVMDKLRALYPSLTDTEIKTSSLEELTSHDLMAKLGTVKIIVEDDSDTFANAVEKFIESTDLSSSEFEDFDDSPRPSYWPIIQEVGIFAKGRYTRVWIHLCRSPWC